MKEIKRIIVQYDQLKASGVKMALASVVNIKESSYLRIEARKIVAENRSWTGGISGECFEDDTLKRAKITITKNTPSLAVYNTQKETQSEIGVGLGCKGIMVVLFNPIDINDASYEIELLREAINKNKPSNLLKETEHKNDLCLIARAQLVSSIPAEYQFFSIADLEIKQAIQKVSMHRRPQVNKLFNTDWQELVLLIESLRPDIKLVIIGDNFDILLLINPTKVLIWEVLLIGRKRKMPKEIYSSCNAFYDYDEFAQVPFDDYTACILMTNDYNKYLKLLPKILQLNPPCIGMLGPKKRYMKMSKELKIDLLQTNNFFSPVGLDVGAETPEEIALSEASQEIITF